MENNINNNDNVNNTNNNNENNFSISEYLCKQSFLPAGVYGDNQEEVLKDLVAVQKEIPTIKKDGQAKGSKSNSPNYKYAKLDDILEIIKPILTKHNFVITQPPYSDGTFTGVQTVLLHSSGGGVRSTPLVYNYSKILFNGNELQNVGSLLSYLRRYSVNGLLCLDLDDDNDGKNWSGKSGNSHYSDNSHYSNSGYSNNDSHQKPKETESYQLITDEQTAKINSLLTQMKLNWEKFKAANKKMQPGLMMQELTTADATNLIKMLEGKIEEMKAKAKAKTESESA